MTSKWMHEELTEEYHASYKLKDVYFEGKSEFQTIDVVELGHWGRTLILDGKIQSSESDEFIYHESLVHPALLLHPNPKTVFIAGGGEGATAREILRHNTVEKLVMVDIDAKCVEVSRKHLPRHSAGAYENSRLELVIQDAKQYLIDYQGTFDVIFCDLADPLEDGPCYLLYTQEFYTMIKTKLAPNGILVTQSGPGGLAAADEVAIPVHNTLKKVFKHVTSYLSYVPSFMDIYSFAIASDDIDIAKIPDESHINDEIEKRIDATEETGRKEDPNAKGSKALGFYDGEVHRGLFALPKFFREKIRTNTTIITDDNPKFFSHGDQVKANQ